MKFIDISVSKAKSWENKFPFKAYQTNPCIFLRSLMLLAFISVTNAAGGSNLPTFIRAEPPSIQ